VAILSEGVAGLEANLASAKLTTWNSWDGKMLDIEFDQEAKILTLRIPMESEDAGIADAAILEAAFYKLLMFAVMSDETIKDRLDAALKRAWSD